MPRPSLATERREAILQAFESCALRKGLRATTLADVAEEADLPRPLIRHFIGNRAELVDGLIERMMQRATRAIDAALDGVDQASPDAALGIILEHSFIDPISNRLMMQLWQESWEDDALALQIQDVYRRCIEQVHDRLFSKPGRTTHDLAFAITAMALGKALLGEFDLQPGKRDALLRAAQAITAIAPAKTRPSKRK